MHCSHSLPLLYLSYCSDYITSFSQRFAAENTTAAFLDFTLSQKLGLSHTVAKLQEHPACLFTLSLPLYQSSLQRLEILFVGCYTLKKQPEGFIVQRQGRQKYGRKRELLLSSRKLSHKEIHQNTPEQLSRGDELTVSRTRFIGFTT